MRRGGGRRPRITYLIHQYLPRHVGGTETYAHALARATRDAGFDVEVVTYHESESGSPDDYGLVRKRHDAIRVHELHYNLSVSPRPAHYEYDNRFTAATIERLLRKRGGVVHVMHAMKLSGSVLRTCHRARIPMVVTLTDYWAVCPRHTLLRSNGSLCAGPDGPLACVECLRDLHGYPREGDRGDLRAVAVRNASVARSLLKADRIIALSAFQKRMLVANGLPDDRIDVIAHGLDTTGFTSARPRERKPFRLVFIGNLVPHKGAHIAVRALSAIQGVSVELELHGEVPANAYGDELVSAAESDPRVKLAGRFDPASFGRIIGDADAVVVPAQWYENDPLVVKAAFYTGTFVLASDLGSLAEMITPDKNGWLVDPTDVCAWAHAFAALASGNFPTSVDPTPVKTMGENAREMIAIYNDLMAARV